MYLVQYGHNPHSHSSHAGRQCQNHQDIHRIWSSSYALLGDRNHRFDCRLTMVPKTTTLEEMSYKVMLISTKYSILIHLHCSQIGRQHCACQCCILSLSAHDRLLHSPASSNARLDRWKRSAMGTRIQGSRHFLQGFPGPHWCRW